jgi:hypothetical protein
LFTFLTLALTGKGETAKERPGSSPATTECRKKPQILSKSCKKIQKTICQSKHRPEREKEKQKESGPEAAPQRPSAARSWSLFA